MKLAVPIVLLLMCCAGDPPPEPVTRPAVLQEALSEDELERRIAETLGGLAEWCAERGLHEAGRELVNEILYVDPPNRTARTLRVPLSEEASPSAADRRALGDRRTEVGRIVAPLYLELFAQKHRPGQNAMYDVYLLRALQHDPDAAADVFERTWRTAARQEDWSRARMLVDRGGALVGIPDRHRLLRQFDAAELARITPHLVPGGTFMLKFPELGPTVKKDYRLMQMQVVLPDDYSPDRPCPLYISLGGGRGSDRPNKLTRGLGFVAVGLPYPRNPRNLAQAAFRPQTLWSSYKPMLAKLERVVPNLHPTDRVVFGFSNGANAITALAAFSDAEFTKQYRYLIIHEGGMYQGQWSDEVWADLRSGAVLYSGGDRSFGRRLSGMHEQAVGKNVDAELLIYAGGHEINGEVRRAARAWIRSRVGN